jgi:hypothetical protein
MGVVVVMILCPHHGKVWRGASTSRGGTVDMVVVRQPSCATWSLSWPSSSPSDLSRVLYMSW